MLANGKKMGASKNWFVAPDFLKQARDGELVSPSNGRKKESSRLMTLLQNGEHIACSGHCFILVYHGELINRPITFSNPV